MFIMTQRAKEERKVMERDMLGMNRSTAMTFVENTEMENQRERCWKELWALYMYVGVERSPIYLGLLSHYDSTC